MQPNPAPRWQPPTERNPQTAARFRRESWWQITFPMLMVTLLMFGCLAGLFFLSGEEGVSAVADYSLILLILPMLVIGLATFALVVVLIGLVGKGIHALPPYTYVAHKAVFNIRSRVESVAGMITGVIISIRSFVDGIIQFIEDRLQPKPSAGPAPQAAGPSTASNKRRRPPSASSG